MDIVIVDAKNATYRRDFIRFVNKQGPYPKKYTKVKTRCWLWTGGKSSAGYGIYHLPGTNKIVLAHRYSYELFKGEGSLLGVQGCHKCDIRNCVRPSHVFPGTQLDNERDKIAKGKGNNGIRNGQAKLTLIQVRLIRSIYRLEKISYKQLGLLFDISPMSVCRIVRKESYR